AAQFQLNGGTVDIGGDILVQRFALAQSAAGNFAYTIPSNQSVRTTGTLSLGAGGTAELTLEQGGATLDTMNAYIGEGLVGMGTVHVRNGRTWNVEQFLRIGHKGTGVVNLVSGTINSEALSGTKGIRMAELSTGDATLVMGLPGGSGSADPVINSKIANFETSAAGRGRVLMHHGTVHQLGANIIIGQVAGSEGTFTMMDGLVNVQPGSLRVGNTGTGLFEQVSGDVVVGGTLDLGNAGAASGTYLMHGGTVSTTNSLLVGNLADGRFELNNGTINVGTSLVVGSGSGGQGLLVMTNGLLNVGTRAANNLVIGNANTNATTGVVRIEGGVVNLSRGLILAQQGTSSSGTLIVGTVDGSNAPVINMQTVSSANFEVANKGTGTFLFHSGLITMNNNNFITGQSLGSVAQVSIGGGTAEARLEMTGGNGFRDWNVNSGQGIVSILSNGVVNVGRDMNLGNNTNLTSGLDLTLDGGTLRLGAGGSAGNINFRAGGPLDQVNLLDGVFHSNGGQINLAGSSTTNFHFSGGMLANFAAVSNGSLTQDGGLLRVGDTNLVRSFTINGGNDYIQNSGVLEIDIAGPGGAGVSNGHDRVVLSGDLGLAGSLVVNSPHTANPGDAFTIIQNNGTNLVNGTFSGLPEGTKLIAGANVFSITYTGGSGNEVVLTATDPALEIVALPPLREVGGVRLFFTGVPNTAYTIQFADNTLPPPHVWQAISTLVSGPAGALELLHVPASASEFYRAIR
ncbi:MAG: hypothetical protein VCG02_08005, partial [Verrucomicrobiota bacterium]